MAVVAVMALLREGAGRPPAPLCAEGGTPLVFLLPCDGGCQQRMTCTPFSVKASMYSSSMMCARNVVSCFRDEVLSHCVV